MPIYEYACTACGERVEARQSFTDPPLEDCEICGGKLRKLYSPVGIVFKGSGFYATDGKKEKKGSNSSSSGSGSSEGSSGGETKAEGKDGSSGSPSGSKDDKKTDNKASSSAASSKKESPSK